MTTAAPLTAAEKIALLELIKVRPEFVATKCADEETLSYNARRCFDTIIVLEFFESDMETDHEFLVFNYREDTLRTTTPVEDAMCRYADDEEPMLEDADTVFICHKDADGVETYEEPLERVLKAAKTTTEKEQEA